ncbi:MAG: DUF2252 family protein [Archangium sp.]|nr:DUF2252 family protein [Archangium sp.]MDP3152223.1 DUF2252 family protein [Archangium sp.]MDP3571068.1 DUF2252 family protein [Archangium sp.]
MTLAAVQLEADRKRLGRSPSLLRRKWQRMAASPFAFLRGASALWAEALRLEPALLRGLPGAGTLVGDLHLENIGTFRTARGVALHVNDFDETFEGPWSFDVARLLTSTLLARPELQVTGLEVIALAEQLLEGHAAGVAGAPGKLPTTLTRTVQAAAGKLDEKLLAKRLETPDRLLRDEKNPPAPAWCVPLVKQALTAWSEATSQSEPVSLVDLTRRVAGTGSLGVERLMALVKVGEVSRLLEFKEVRGSSFAELQADATSLLAAWGKCLPRPPLEVAAAALGAIPIIVRPLFACDDKLAVEDFDREALPQTLRAIGVMAGEVHRRGAKTMGKWNAGHRRVLMDRAAHLAGLHEQAFVAFCQGVHEQFGD